MRTTITLTPEADAAVRRLMRERGMSFKDAVNLAITQGAAPSERRPFHTRTVSMGAALMPVDRALELAGRLEDQELLRRQERRQ